MIAIDIFVNQTLSVMKETRLCSASPRGRYLSFTGIAMYLLFISAPINFSFAQAPAIEWQRCYGGTDNEYPAGSIQQTADGGYYIFGKAYSNDGDVHGQHGDADLWVARLNFAGDTLWTRCFGGGADESPGNGFQTADSGFIISGSTYSEDGDVSGNHGTSDAWVVKLDANGDTSWTRCYGGSSMEIAFSIRPTVDGNYILACLAVSDNGDVKNNYGGSDAWITKLDLNGDTLWSKCLGGTGSDNANYAVQTDDKGFIMAGGTTSHDGYVSGGHGSFDSWVVKLDSVRDTVWTKCLGGTSWDQAGCIRKTSDGGYISAMYSNSDDGDVKTNHGGFDFWIVKMNSSGDILWTKILGGSYDEKPYYITETNDNGYIVAGYSGSDDGDVTGNMGGDDAWIVKLNQNGEKLWDKCLGGWDQDEAHCIIQTDDGGYLVAGTTRSQDGYVTGHHGETDIWVVKLSSDNTGNKPVMLKDNMITVSPNPLSGYSVIEFPNPCHENYKLTVTDPAGRIVRTIKDITGDEFLFEKENLQKGIYFIELIGDKYYRTQIIVK